MKPIQLESTKDMDKQVWLKLRQRGIGGSDASAIVGQNKYSSALRVYLEKVIPIEKQRDRFSEISKEKMRTGNDLEQYVAERFAEEFGVKVRRRNYIFQHPDYPFMLANIDREVVGKNEGLECKVSYNAYTDEWEGDGIPPMYELQCVHYMAVMGYDRYHIAVLHQGVMKYRTIERDNEYIELLIAKEKDFWENYVEKRIEPAPDGSDSCDDIVKERYPQSTPMYDMQLNDGIWNEKLGRLLELKELEAEVKKDKKAHEQALKMELGNAESATTSKFKITWKSNKNGIRSLRIKKAK